MKLAFLVSANELLAKGAPLTAIKQSYRPNDSYTEVVKTRTESGATDAYIAYEANGSARDNTYYVLPAKDASGNDVAAVTSSSTKTVVWGGSIKNSYVKIS